MRILGWLLLLLGGFGVSVALITDTTVDAGRGLGRVHNLQKADMKQSLLVASSATAVVGALFVVFGGRSTGSSPATASTELGATRVCPHCAETVKAAATVCRFCQRELPPLDVEALSAEPATCPACEQGVTMGALSCKCGASFEPGSAWKPIAKAA